MSDRAFKFTVIIITDEDENKTRQTFDSIINQNCFEEKIQVVFFGRMNSVCQKALAEFPENAVFVDSEPDKLLSQALEYAEGKYCLICKDGGYVKYKSTFKKVERLFRENKENTDAVILKTYDCAGKGDFLNYKFANDGNLIDLAEHPEYIHTKLDSVFAHTKVLKSAIADVGEDNETVVLAKILSKKQKYAVSEDRYVIGAEKNRNAEDVAGFCGSALREWGKLHNLEFFRKALVYELSKLNDNNFISKKDQGELLTVVKVLLELIGNQDIATFNRIDFTKRFGLLKVKNGSFRSKKKLLSGKIADSCIYADKENIGRSEDIPAVLYFVAAENGKITVEASLGNACGLYRSVSPIAKLSGKSVEVKENKEAFRYTSFLSENVIEYRMFKLEFDSELIKSELSLKLGLNCDGIEVFPEKLSFNSTCLLEGKYTHHYLYDNGFAFVCKGNEIIISPCDEEKRQETEAAFIGDLANSKLPDKDELIALRQEYFAKKDSLEKPIWLISDRPLRAGDNGEVFFEYVMKNHSEDVEVYFVLSRDSEDYERVSAMGNVVEPLSYEHKLLFLLAEKNISAQADIYVTNPFGKSRRAVHDLMKSDFIFLQHGVIKDDLSDWLYRYKKNIKGFVTSSPYEHKSVTEGSYGYDKETIWLTGLPRFDQLYDDNRKIITFMPTWRKYLVASQNSLTGVREFDASFTESEFYTFYNSVVNNDKLLSAADKMGYTIAFLPHPNMVESMQFFDLDNRITIYAPSRSYRDIYAESALVITDYSSAVFDFAYLRKPIIYCQFDKERFFSGEHRYTKGYFDYERDGFGEVEYDAESTVERIIEYMQNGCKMKEKYISRADDFFAFDDKDNCKRVYDKIKNME